jgi:hypothetical protein
MPKFEANESHSKSSQYPSHSHHLTCQFEAWTWLNILDLSPNHAVTFQVAGFLSSPRKSRTLPSVGPRALRFERTGP